MTRLTPYSVNLQRPFDKFWLEYGTQNRKVLFIFGAGFDPRCLPALRVVAQTFQSGAELHTFCARFTNYRDEYFAENMEYTSRSLQEICSITNRLRGGSFKHYEVEVSMFSKQGRLIGDRLLLREFRSCCGEALTTYTDVIVDISAFPRTLVFALLSYLWRARPGRNLFAVLTETPVQVRIEESGHRRPTYMLGGLKPVSDARILWIPVLGGAVKRFEGIYSFLKPVDIVPIIPFPARNPRVGDDILLDIWRTTFREWEVPFRNVMYASADNPFDVFRKIQDVIGIYENYSQLDPKLSVVVSALSGRSLSLGVLLAALWSELMMCHAQPRTYRIDMETRDRLNRACDGIIPKLYWLDGELYTL